MRRFHEAKRDGLKSVTVWGTGKPKREFLFVDDMADACLHVAGLDADTYATATEPMLSHLNLGTGEDIEIGEVARMIAQIVGYSGDILFDTDKPDGTPRKLMDVSRLDHLGWRAKTSLKDGLNQTYDWYLANEATRRG